MPETTATTEERTPPSHGDNKEAQEQDTTKDGDEAAAPSAAEATGTSDSSKPSLKGVTKRASVVGMGQEPDVMAVSETTRLRQEAEATEAATEDDDEAAREGKTASDKQHARDTLQKKRIKAERLANNNNSDATAAGAVSVGAFSVGVTATATGTSHLPSLSASVADKRQARVDKKMAEAGLPTLDGSVKKPDAPGVAVGSEPMTGMVINDQEREARYQKKMQEANAENIGAHQEMDAASKFSKSCNTTKPSTVVEQKRQARYENKMNAAEETKQEEVVASKEISVTSTDMNQTKAARYENKMKEVGKMFDEHAGGGTNVRVPGVERVDSKFQVDQKSQDLEAGGQDTNDAAMVDGDAPEPMSFEATLVEATLVEEHGDDMRAGLSKVQENSKPLVMAHAVEEESGLFGSKRNLCIAGLLLLAVVGLTVGATCGAGACAGKDAEPSVVIVNFTLAPSAPPTQIPTIAPSPAPTQIPTMSPTEYKIQGLPPFTLEAFSDTNSPQAQAYKWVIEDPNVGNYANERLLQRLALATVFYAMNGPQWKDNTGWLSYEDDECTWFTKVDEPAYPEHTGNPCFEDLSYRFLTPWDNRGSGTIPPEISLLTSLEILDFSYSVLTGTIPSELAILTNLRVLFLSDTINLSGTIMTEIGALTDLVTLALGTTRILGSIPSQLGELSQLEKLNLQDSSLTGFIPTQLGVLSLLEGLWLFGNDISGSIPSELGMLSSYLQYLEADNNHFTGTLPSELGSLNSLSNLHLFSNNVTGPIPSELGSLQNLEELKLHANFLSSTIPNELGQLPISYLDVSSNNLEGNVGNLTFTTTRLQTLFLHDNSFTGIMPQKFCSINVELSFDCSIDLCGCDCDCVTGQQMGYGDDTDDNIIDVDEGGDGDSN